MIPKLYSSKPYTSILAILVITAMLLLEKLPFRDINHLHAIRFITYLISGAVLFRSKSMGLTWTRNSCRYSCLAWLPLIVAILLNSSIDVLLVSRGLSDENAIRVVIVGLWEETFFRGFLLAFWAYAIGLEKPLYRVIFVVLSSVLFFLCHRVENVSTGIFITGMGIMLATIRIRTETIYWGIVLHIINNALSKLPVIYLNTGLRDVFVIFFVLVSLWIVCRMAGADETNNPSENRQNLAP